MKISCYIKFSFNEYDEDYDFVETAKSRIDSSIANKLGIALNTPSSKLTDDEYNRLCDYHNVPKQDVLVTADIDTIDPEEYPNMLYKDAYSDCLAFFTDKYGVEVIKCKFDKGYFEVLRKNKNNFHLSHSAK